MSLATPLGNETTASRQPKTNGFAAVAFSLRDGEDEHMPKMEDAIGGLRPNKFYSVDFTPSPSSSRLCTPSHFSSRLYTPHLSPALEFLLRLSAYVFIFSLWLQSSSSSISPSPKFPFLPLLVPLPPEFDWLQARDKLAGFGQGFNTVTHQDLPARGKSGDGQFDFVE
ncbi:hypothetical protein NL676_020702 [Syzygium grande]|nr:hypothetical protein NL676_020702 [Syzygium grande]